MEIRHNSKKSRRLRRFSGSPVSHNLNSSLNFSFVQRALRLMPTIGAYHGMARIREKCHDFFRFRLEGSRLILDVSQYFFVKLDVCTLAIKKE